MRKVHDVFETSFLRGNLERDRNAGPKRLQPHTTAILSVYHRADGIAGLSSLLTTTPPVDPLAPVSPR
jgi:hypothetical protein